MTKKKIGTVVSTNMNKTIILTVENKYAHPIYSKILKKNQRFMAHDEENECQLGDIVKICEVRPVSRKKYWSLKQILNKIKN
jgi:small subunit ribosomal protein S17